MLNVYKYYDTPKDLLSYDEKYPELVAINQLIDDPWELTDEQSDILKHNHYVMTTPGLAYKCARYVIKDRWPEAEPYIKKVPIYAYNYVLDVINKENKMSYNPLDRWEDAEPYIMQSPLYADYYARIVMRKRWLEAEPIIKTDDNAWSKYRGFFNI